MKILYVLEYYHPNIGGVEKLFKSLAEEMAIENEVLVITNRHDRSLSKEETINGVRIKRLDLHNRFLFSFLSFPYILKHARKYDLIHTTSYNAALPAWIVAKLSGKKLIITFHEIWDKLWFKLPFINCFQKLGYWLFEKLITKLNFNRFIAVSDYTKDCLIESGVKADKIVRIYNGLDYKKKNIKDSEHKSFSFAFNGRLGISKGLDLLIPAAYRFISKNPKSYFKIISPDKPDGMYKKIKKLISKYDFGNNIRLLHGLSDEEKNKELISSDCIVIPSYSEGFCFVAAEASAMKIPIISSGLGALDEVVSGESISMNEMSVGSLYEALVEAKNSNYTYTQRKEFPLGECISNYKKVYYDLLDDR